MTRLDRRRANLRVESSPRPGLLRAAVGTYLASAVLNLAVGGWTLAYVPAAIESLNSEGHRTAAPGIAVAVALIAVATLAFSAALVVLTFRLRAGNGWARPWLLTVSLLSLVALVTGGGPGVAVIVLLAVAAVLVSRRPVTAWLRAAAGLDPP